MEKKLEKYLNEDKNEIPLGGQHWADDLQAMDFNSINIYTKDIPGYKEKNMEACSNCWHMLDEVKIDGVNRIICDKYSKPPMAKITMPDGICDSYKRTG